jgi:serine protease Do
MMVKKTLLITTLVSSMLFGTSVHINNAPANPKHRLPNGKNEILSFNSVLKDAINAVVNISTKKINYRGDINRRFFREFFGRDLPPKKSANSLGSGVIVSSDGYIVTNNHVIDGADEISVTINDRDKEYIAKVIGRDKDSDLAVIKIEAENLKPIKFSNIRDVKLGDVVFAIGDPFGVGQTVTQGIISAMNKYGVGINKYENFIQTDASINPGNSGGALIDSRGALIGINSAIISSSGGNNGVGFTIPVDMVKNVVTKLIEHGRVDRGFMGVNISKVTKELEPLYKRRHGAIVVNVQENSPAERAGIQRGDLIYGVNNRSVKEPHELQHIIMSLNPNETITLSIERDKVDIKKSLKLSNLEGDLLDLGSIDRSFNGLYLSELKNQNGVIVKKVKFNSQAYRDGFNVGDIIIQVENRAINSLSDVKDIFTRYRGRAKRIYINRKGTILLIVKR